MLTIPSYVKVSPEKENSAAGFELDTKLKPV